MGEHGSLGLCAECTLILQHVEEEEEEALHAKRVEERALRAAAEAKEEELKKAHKLRVENSIIDIGVALTSIAARLNKRIFVSDC